MEIKKQPFFQISKKYLKSPHRLKENSVLRRFSIRTPGRDILSEMRFPRKGRLTMYQKAENFWQSIRQAIGILYADVPEEGPDALEEDD